MALGEELLAYVLLALEIDALLELCSVCKAWRGMIKSDWFRKEWCERHREEKSSVLLSFASCDSLGERVGIRRWLPPVSGSKEGIVSPYLQIKIPGFDNSQFDIVASSNGLLCACLDHHNWRYAVGNPVTGEWVHLPPPLPQPEAQVDGMTRYCLRAESTGEFKLQALYYGCLAVYSSKPRCWSVSKLPDADLYEYIHDFDDGWVIVQVPVKLKTRLPIPMEHLEPTEEVFCNAATWSYRGETYLAASILNDAYSSWPMEHIVWKACRLDKQEYSSLELGGATCLRWDTGVSEEQVVCEDVFLRDWAEEAEMVCHGEGRFCAFATYLAMSRQAPGIYDVSSKVWYHLQQFSLKGDVLEACTRAVVYHPSLIKPDEGSASHGVTIRKRKASFDDASSQLVRFPPAIPVLV